MKAKELITWKKIYPCWLLEIVSKPYILDFYLLVTLMKNYTDLSIVCLTTQNNKDICSFWPHDDFNGINVPIIFFLDVIHQVIDVNSFIKGYVDEIKGGRKRIFWIYVNHNEGHVL